MVNQYTQTDGLLRKSIRFIWILIVAVGVTSSGCKDDDDDDKEENPSEYYVKYIVNSSTVYSAVNLDMTFNNEKNILTTVGIYANSKEEVIVGPVGKGFIAILKVNKTISGATDLKLSAEIQVSKDGSPFAFKKLDGSNTPRSSVQISYQIDY